METQAEYVTITDQINYHCPRCMKRKTHMRQIFGANEYLTCRTCGNVVHFINRDHHEITEPR